MPRCGLMGNYLTDHVTPVGIELAQVFSASDTCNSLSPWLLKHSGISVACRVLQRPGESLLRPGCLGNATRSSWRWWGPCWPSSPFSSHTTQCLLGYFPLYWSISCLRSIFLSAFPQTKRAGSFLHFYLCPKNNGWQITAPQTFHFIEWMHKFWQCPAFQ